MSASAPTPSDLQPLQEQVIALEAHVAHLEHTQQELSDVLATQWDQIDRLTRTVELLHRKMQSLEPAHEVHRPPHY